MLGVAYGSRVANGSEAHRSTIVDAAAVLLLREGAHGLNVRAVMREAGVSRTAFYRQFDSMHDVLRALLERLLAQLEAGATDWMRVPEAVGTPDIVGRNMLQTGRHLQPHAPLLCAIADAAGSDPTLRQLWRDRVVQARIDATEAAIRRDQAAGTVRGTLDATDTARALTLMVESLALEILGRRGGTPEEFARVTTPIWLHVLFADDAIDAATPAISGDRRRRGGPGSPAGS